MDTFFVSPKLEDILQVIFIIFGTLIAGYIFNRTYSRFIQKSTAIIHNDPTNYKFVGHFLMAVIYIIGFSWAIYEVPKLRSLASSLLAGAGILAVAVGFASQQALGNIISGLFIVIFKPFRVNDRLKLRDNSLSGIVEDITLRHTIIRDFENRRIIIPNAVINQEIITNSDFGDDKICKFIEVDISYEANLETAKKILEHEILHHPLHIDARTTEQIANGDPEVPVKVISLGEYAIRIRGWAWTKDSASAFDLYCDIIENIKKRFDEEHIEIPYPHRIIIHRKEEDIKNIVGDLAD
ncbi:MAG: mechanosensitive ion channel family protein [Saprospiraceae bacterium]|nr:mechanosensitive ion channel family protein [Saprospiraceae bacterium]MBP7679594.1 mechanosensitive ion channel family protein [Saprospiraceae bacterium]